MATSDIERVKRALTAKRTRQSAIPAKDFLSTGSTLLNCAASGRPNGGFAKGKYYWIAGASMAAKTWLGLTCIAEACLNKEFKNYDLYRDDTEGDGALMDIGAYFGPETAKRLRAPRYDDKNNPLHSRTVEEFYYNLHECSKRAHKTGRPFIYVLDSENGLDSEAAEDKFLEQKKAHEKGREAAGSYGDGKAKFHSQNLRRVVADLRDTGSILIVLSQLRDNIGAMGYGEKERTSGGRGLRYWATLEIWTHVVGKLKKTVNGKKRTIGVMIEARFKKNRFTGRDRTVTIPIYHSHGIDDVGSCVDFLVDEGHWKEVRKKEGGGVAIKAPEVDFVGNREELIAHIEKNDLEQGVRVLVGELWQKIEDACTVQRKNRYGGSA